MVHDVIRFVLVTVVLSILTVDGASPTSCPTGYVYAECRLQKNPNNRDAAIQIEGTVYFRQRVTSSCRRLGMLCIHMEIQGIPRNVDNHYGIHVHVSSDFTNGCESMLGHFNPLGSNHGAPTDSLDMRHLGDLGNVRPLSEGRVNETRTDYLANLVGSHSILDRGLVLHAMRDDLGLGGDAGSLATGNAGARLACCAIRQTLTSTKF